MTILVRFLMVMALLAMADAAAAHPVIQGASGFTGGMLHPLLVPAHVMAVLALALLLGQQPMHPRRAALIVYIAAVIAGLGVIALAVVPIFAGEALLALALLCGGLAALARPVPMPLGWLLAGGTGLALALDSPPETLSLTEANAALLGTALGAVILLVALAECAARLTRDWQRIGARIIGSWIAASAVLVLALRFVR